MSSALAKTQAGRYLWPWRIPGDLPGDVIHAPAPSTMIQLTGRSSTLATTLRDAALRADPRRWTARTKLALKTAVGLLVLFAVGRHVLKTWHTLQEHGESLRVQPAWIAVGVLLYLVGLGAFGVFFWRVLEESPTPLRLLPALRAYLISHLGKYVPGKALVVVMRVGLVTPHGARPATAAFATLYETLVMMAAGGLLAALGFLARPIELWPIAAGVGLGLAFLVVVDPRVFPRIASVASRPLKGVGADALPRFSTRLLAEGLLWSSAGWVLLGLSQVAVIRALRPEGVEAGLWPLVAASVALATVAGFAVAVLPGGLGVREGLLMVTLEPAIGAEPAVLGALALRLTWVLGELLAAAALAGAGPRPLGPSPESPAS